MKSPAAQSSREDDALACRAPRAGDLLIASGECAHAVLGVDRGGALAMRQGHAVVGGHRGGRIIVSGVLTARLSDAVLPGDGGGAAVAIGRRRTHIALGNRRGVVAERQCNALVTFDRGGDVVAALAAVLSSPVVVVVMLLPRVAHA